MDAVGLRETAKMVFGSLLGGPDIAIGKTENLEKFSSRYLPVPLSKHTRAPPRPNKGQDRAEHRRSTTQRRVPGNALARCSRALQVHAGREIGPAIETSVP